MWLVIFSLVFMLSFPLLCCVCHMIWLQDPIGSHHVWELRCLQQALLHPLPLGRVSRYASTSRLCARECGVILWCHLSRVLYIQRLYGRTAISTNGGRLSRSIVDAFPPALHAGMTFVGVWRLCPYRSHFLVALSFWWSVSVFAWPTIHITLDLRLHIPVWVIW